MRVSKTNAFEFFSTINHFLYQFAIKVMNFIVPSTDKEPFKCSFKAAIFLLSKRRTHKLTFCRSIDEGYKTFLERLGASFKMLFSSALNTFCKSLTYTCRNFKIIIKFNRLLHIVWYIRNNKCLKSIFLVKPIISD